MHLSHDGKYLATSVEGEAMLLVPTDGSGPRELMHAGIGQSLYFTSWAPDSKSVFVWSQVGPDTRQLWRKLAIASGTPRQVEFGADMDRILGPILIIDPQGTTAAYTVDTAATPRELWVLEVGR